MKTGVVNRLMVLAAAVTVLLVLSLIYSVFAVTRFPLPEPEQPAQATLEAHELKVKQVSQAQSAAFTERPLFWSSRRPYVPEPDVPEETPVRRGPDPFDDFKLVGVFAGSSASAGVILLKGSERERLLMGDQLHDWELTSMTPASATFMRISGSGYEEKTIDLVYAASTGVPAKNVPVKDVPAKAVPAAPAKAAAPSSSSPEEDN